MEGLRGDVGLIDVARPRRPAVVEEIAVGGLKGREKPWPQVCDEELHESLLREAGFVDSTEPLVCEGRKDRESYSG